MKKSQRLLSLFSINKMMIVAILAGLTVVSCNSDDDGVDPVPSFEVTLDGAFVTFTNTSVDAESSAWTFGDGTESNETNPVHRYAASGDYEVFLQVVNGANAAATSQVITVEVPEAGNASFTFEAVDREVTFTNTSSAGTTVGWDFGDGVGTSTEDNPVYIYEEDGSYTVTLTVLGADGEEDTFSDTVEAVVAIPVAAFTSTLEGEFEVTFTNESTDADTFAWDFGDGVGTSTEESPVYIYAGEGTFTVSLTATNDNGNEDTIMIDVVVEDVVVLPVASFTTNPEGLTVAFMNTSEMNDGNITAFAWEFGDTAGGTSTEENPMYTYAEAGDFDVTLTITFDDLDGETTATFTETITVSEDSAVVGAIIRDTTTDTGELRYGVDAIISGRLEVTFTRTLQAVNQTGGNRNGFISLLNSSGSTSEGRSIMDLSVGATEFSVRDHRGELADPDDPDDFDDPDDLDFSGIASTPGTLQTAVVTWTAPDADTPPTVNLSIDGVDIQTFTSIAGVGGLRRVQFRFGDNSSLISSDSFFTIESFEVFSDVAGTTSVFSTDFSEFSIGEVLDGVGTGDFFGNSVEATVEVIN